jgi:hypothetical protein
MATRDKSIHSEKFFHRKGEHNVIPDWQSHDCSYLNNLEFDKMKKMMKRESIPLF